MSPLWGQLVQSSGDCMLPGAFPFLLCAVHVCLCVGVNMCGCKCARMNVSVGSTYLVFPVTHHLRLDRVSH